MVQKGKEGGGYATPLDEVPIITLDTEGVVVSTADDQEIKIIEVDNSRNSVDVYLKGYDAETVDHSADEPDFVFKVPAGASGILPIQAPIGSGSPNVFENGLCMAASTGNSTSGGDPPSDFNCVICKQDQ